MSGDGKTWEDREAEKAYQVAKLRQGGKKRCAKCGFYGCICQTSLQMFDPLRLRTTTFTLPHKSYTPLEVRNIIYQIVRTVRIDNLDDVQILIESKEAEA